MSIASAADNLFPLDINTRRIYTSDTGTLTERVTGTQAVAGGTGTVFSAVDSADGYDDRSVYIVGSTGVRVYAAAGADVLERAFDGVELMRWPTLAGDRFVQVDKTLDSGEDVDGDGRTDAVTVRSELTAVARETVVTAAGSFSDSLHQRQAVRVSLQPSRGGAPVVVDYTIDEWYAPYVGLVKRTTLTTPSGGVASTSTASLQAYRVGGRSSDMTAPVVTGVAPDSAPVRGSAVTLSVQFSKAMDPASFATAGSLMVVDSAGARIAGTVQVQGQTARFIAAQTWASGSYTATLSTAAQDLLGQALAAPVSWTFTVDATAPGVVSVSPAGEALDVGLTSSAVLEFSEPPDPASINNANIRLLRNDLPVPVQLSVEGKRVTVTPSAALDPAALYLLTVDRVTDAVGNVMGSYYTSRFFTTQGRFAYNQDLFPGWSIRATAVGDVDGDGIPDVLALGQTNMVVPEQGLLLRKGLANGTLAAAVRLDLAVGWGTSLLAIGDVNGDGRPDVLLPVGDCPLQVLAQTAGGTLVPGQCLSTAFGSSLHLADVDGDGRLDMVMGYHGIFGKIEVWRQGMDGLLSKTTSIDPGVSVSKVVVGDIDGDGRADIVAAVSGFLGQDVLVLRQLAGGGFAAPQILSTESPWGASAVALGDINGDGRTDIVATTGGNSPTYLAVFYQAAGGAIGPLTRLATYDNPSTLRLADIDGDGRTDIVVSHSGFSRLGVYLQQPGGTLAAEQRFSAPSFADSMAVGDINRDGLPDIVLGGEWLRQLPQASSPSLTSPGSATQVLRLRGGLPRR